MAEKSARRGRGGIAQSGGADSRRHGCALRSGQGFAEDRGARTGGDGIEESSRTQSKGAECHPSKTYNTSATKLLQEGKFEEASAKLQQALRLDPQSAAVHYNYGVALFEMNQFEQAITELRSSLSLNADQADAYYYLGRASLAMGQPAAAAKDLEQGLRLNGRDARAHNVRAIALAELHEYPEASKELQAAVEEEPGNGTFRDNLDCLERRLAGCTLRQ